MQATTLQEKDILNDLLSQEKQIMSTYSTYIAEASCPNLRNVLSQNFSESCHDQYKIFDMMSQKGYYPLRAAQQSEVTQIQQKFEQMKSQLQ